MSKVTKKDLNERLLMVETLLGLHRALPEQISNDQANNAIFRMQCALSSGKELAERKPQLKQLDQSVFDGIDEKWRFAAVDKCGEVWYSTHKTQPSVSGTHLSPEPNADSMQAKDYYDASNWQNSLIERDIAKELLEVDLSSELTGSDLARAMLERGDKWIVCRLADTSDEDALNNGRPILVTKFDGDFYHKEADQYWRCAVPINNQGEPLTAAEAGL